MSGLVFYRTDSLASVVEFYVDRVGATVWLEQPDCTILDYDGFRFGFCERATVDDCGILTFLFDDRAGVEDAYERLADVAGADEPPAENPTYEVYHWFGEDPDGRTVEFQTFLHDLPG